MADITLAQLLEAGVHFGHKAYRWNPKMFPYIYTERNNIHILDLVQSAQLLKEANSYLESASEKGKTFLFVGTKRQASALVAQEAKRCNSYYVNHRWLGGMLTNWTTLRTDCTFKDIRARRSGSSFRFITEKRSFITP
jgi:small subunit ribosomal protein S2